MPYYGNLHLQPSFRLKDTRQWAKNKENTVTNPTPAFSKRYLAQVEAERQYVIQQIKGISNTSVTDMPTLEEAYRSVFVENRNKTPRFSQPPA